jgi:hypothetical protein
VLGDANLSGLSCCGNLLSGICSLLAAAVTENADEDDFEVIKIKNHVNKTDEEKRERKRAASRLYYQKQKQKRDLLKNE